MKLFVIISVFIAANSWGAFENEATSDSVVISEHDNDGLLIYPMPVKGDAFRISGIHTLEIKGIEVFDLTGKLVGQINKNQIDENGEVSAEHFSSGTYILSIIFNDRTVKKKIIIE